MFINNVTLKSKKSFKIDVDSVTKNKFKNKIDDWCFCNTQIGVLNPFFANRLLRWQFINVFNTCIKYLLL